MPFALKNRVFDSLVVSFFVVKMHDLTETGILSLINLLNSIIDCQYKYLSCPGGTLYG